MSGKGRVGRVYEVGERVTFLEGEKKKSQEEGIDFN